MLVILSYGMYSKHYNDTRINTSSLHFLEHLNVLGYMDGGIYY